MQRHPPWPGRTAQRTPSPTSAESASGCGATLARIAPFKSSAINSPRQAGFPRTSAAKADIRPSAVRAAAISRMSSFSRSGERIPPRPVLLGRDNHDRRRVRDVAVHGVLRGVAEERCQRVEIRLLDGVELVVVAGRAAGGQAQPDRADGIRAVLGVDRVVFVDDHARFVRGREAAVEAGRDPLFERRSGSRSPASCSIGELVERHVGG